MRRVKGASPEQHAITMLEALFLLSLICLGVWLVLSLHVPEGPSAGPASGVIPSVYGDLGGILVAGGNQYIFSRTATTVGDVSLVVPKDATATVTGPVLIKGVHLPTGYLAAVPMQLSKASISGKTRSDNLTFSMARPLPTAAWTVTGFSDIPPFRVQDQDLLLEPGEQLDLVLNPSISMAPGEPVTIVVYPDRGFPLVITGKNPIKISPVNIIEP
jgi:hypothetical protein